MGRLVCGLQDSSLPHRKPLGSEEQLERPSARSTCWSGRLLRATKLSLRLQSHSSEQGRGNTHVSSSLLILSPRGALGQPRGSPGSAAGRAGQDLSLLAQAPVPWVLLPAFLFPGEGPRWYDLWRLSQLPLGKEIQPDTLTNVLQSPSDC